jgi:hypothetical protein
MHLDGMKQSRLIFCGIIILSLVGIGLWSGWLKIRLLEHPTRLIGTLTMAVEKQFGTSSFKFVNESSRTLRAVELHFVYTGNSTNYAGFSRQFTNIPPGKAITIRVQTPNLLCTEASCFYPPSTNYILGMAFEGPACATYHQNVGSYPGKRTVMSFDSNLNLTVTH